MAEFNDVQKTNATYSNVTDISTDYTITDTDQYATINMTVGASGIVPTLPPLSTNQGRTLRFRKADNGAGTGDVTGDGVEKIRDLQGNLVSVLSVVNQGDCLELQAFATEWGII